MVSVVERARFALRRHANPEVLFVLEDDLPSNDQPATLESHVIDTYVRGVVSTCAGGLSHHFNNVLSGVLGLVSLAPNLDGRALGELCERLKGQVEHTSGILRLVLTLTRRAEREGQEPRCEVRGPLKAAVDLWRTAAPAQVALELGGAVPETWVPTSAVVFGRLLLVAMGAGIELLSAHEGGTLAVEAEPRAGELTVTLTSSAGWAALSDAEPLAAVLARGHAPPTPVVARAALASMAAAAGGSVCFPGGGRLELHLPVVALP